MNMLQRKAWLFLSKFILKAIRRMKIGKELRDTANFVVEKIIKEIRLHLYDSNNKVEDTYR
ncbi:MAG: hypothetical protein J7J57_04190 [Caldisericaceae bacterium]|nr:hypothetical protein [Caldisericaceae bacterium]